MSRSPYDLCADRLQAYAKALQVSVGDCVAQATNLLSDEQSDDRTEIAHVQSEASVALGRVCNGIEAVMAAYDQLQQTVGGTPRYQQVLELLGSRPGPATSAPTPSGRSF